MIYRTGCPKIPFVIITQVFVTVYFHSWYFCIYFNTKFSSYIPVLSPFIRQTLHQFPIGTKSLLLPIAVSADFFEVLLIQIFFCTNLQFPIRINFIFLQMQHLTDFFIFFCNLILFTVAGILFCQIRTILTDFIRNTHRKKRHIRIFSQLPNHLFHSRTKSTAVSLPFKKCGAQHMMRPKRPAHCSSDLPASVFF